MKKQLFPLAILCFSWVLTAQNKLYQSNTYSGLKVRNIGPAFMSGRIADIVKNPHNPSTWYVATASGGVWKTINNATTWTPIFDRYDSYTAGAIAIDPINPNVLWLGTGENASQRSAGYGDGVYKSVDAGKSWKNVGLKKSEHIGKILIDPRNTDVVYVAAQGPLWAPGGNRGLYKTVDGGKTWELALEISENTGITDMVFDPRNPDLIYAASYQRRRHVGILVAGGPESAVYKTEDGGKSWRKLNRGLPGGDAGRIALAVSPQQPDIVYAQIALEDRKGGFYKSTDKGESWSKQNDYIVVDPQYYGEIYADPHHFDRVYSMDVVIQVTDDGGKNFRGLNTRNKHVDNHELIFDPHDPDYLLVGCDGGIYESWDQGDSWKFVSNLPLTQFYRVGIDNATPFYNVYGGTQDNSTLGGPSRTNNIHGIRNSDWFITRGGDGFQTRVDPENPNILYSMSQYAGIVRYDKRSGEGVDIQPQPQPGDDALRWHWDAPLIISPHAPQRLYFAAQRLFRSDDRGNSWTPVSDDLSRNIDRNQVEVMGRIWSPEAVWKNVFTSPLSTVVSLAESKLEEGLIAVGTDDGLLQITEDGGKNWRKIDRFPGVPDQTYVSDLFLSQHDRNTIYALFNNHKNGDFEPYALKSTDLGKNWTTIGSSLPERHITWTIVEDHVDPNLLFLGTEFGLFFSLDQGKNWTQHKSGVPTVAIRDLEIQERENDLVCATFGRGMLIWDDYSPLRYLKDDALDQPAQLFPVKDAWIYIEARPIGSSKGSLGDAFFTAPNPPYGATFTYYLKEGLRSKKQERRTGEKRSLADGGKGSYPNWEQLREEDWEEKPAIVLTVKDADGQIVRRLSGPTSAGFHRVQWDFRYPAFTAGRRGRGSGPIATPGGYSVSLRQYVDGEWTELAKPQSFQTKSLGLATLETEDKAAALAFQQKAGRLQSALLETNNFIENQLEALNRIKASLMSGRESEALLSETRDLELKLKAMQLVLRGDVTRSQRAEFTSPGLIGRLQRVVYGQYHSAAPTKTHQDSYQIARSGFERLYKALKQLTEQELTDWRQSLEAQGIPGATGGGLPVWKED